MIGTSYRSRKKPSVTQVQTVTNPNGKEIGYIQPWDGGRFNVYAIIPGTGRHEHIATITDSIAARGLIEQFRTGRANRAEGATDAK